MTCYIALVIKKCTYIVICITKVPLCNAYFQLPIADWNNLRGEKIWS